MDLRLDDPDVAAQLVYRTDGLINRETGDATRRDDAIFAQEFFCLIFVNFHIPFRVISAVGWKASPGTAGTPIYYSELRSSLDRSQ